MSMLNRTVAEILRQVRTQGDAALIDTSNRFDRRNCTSIEEFCLGADQLQTALETIAPETRKALETAASRIREYHSHQLQDSWQYQEADGTKLGQQITPLERVGYLCARRQGQLPIFCTHELYSRPCGWRRRSDYDGAGTRQ